ncbi:unnamed protein product [Prorocentrum cordatum]|uniref:Major facilitator superfamily (MFS) profile domain-containing protein n=1 Tax=Prorocentrum cordatum TaxID=2364126 RepID=A0ABN9Y6F3_9DINO|nr:unnamed protein product [Polarella glacialis]
MFSFFCMGSAFPQLLYGLAEGFSWRAVVVSTSGLAVVSGIAVYSFVGIGPFPFPSSQFDVQKLLGVCRNRNVMLSIAAYCGHQWELFCVWAWCAQFLENIHDLSHTSAHVWAFVIISMGGPGSWLGGRLGDRYGRVRTALVMVAVSGACTLVLGLLDDLWPFPVWIAICVVWGLTSLADSPNYSALVTISADQQSVGTAVTFQLFCGYFITIRPSCPSGWSPRCPAPGPGAGR